MEEKNLSRIDEIRKDGFTIVLFDGNMEILKSVNCCRWYLIIDKTIFFYGSNNKLIDSFSGEFSKFELITKNY